MQKQIGGVQVEIKLMNQTLQTVSKAFTELKEINTIEFKNVTLKYGENIALKNINYKTEKQNQRDLPSTYLRPLNLMYLILHCPLQHSLKLVYQDHQLN